MKRRISILVLVSSLILILTPVVVIADHGLEWGFNNGESVNFLVSIDYDDNSHNGRIVSSASRSEDIPENITTWSDLPDVGYWMLWDDGTDINDQSFLFEFLPHVGNKRGIPLDNFSFLEELAVDAMVVDSFIDDLTYWGIQRTISHSGGIADISVSYAKTDGLLARHIVNIYDADDELVGRVSIYREGFSQQQPHFEIGNMWILALSGIFFTIFVVNVVTRKR